MASLDEQLRKRGWFLNKEAITDLTEGANDCSADDVIRKALDTDLCEMGSGCIPEDLARNFRNVEKVSGPAVWQIQRIRNTAAPKADPDNDHGNKFLRLHLTDGVTSFSAVLGGKSGLSVQHTPPGTKLLLNPQSVPVCNGFVLLSERDFKILGGTVQHLVEKWKLAKDLSQHKRTSGEAGPPPWVPFGGQIDKDLIKQLKTGGPFKAMDRAGASKGAPNEAFERHRTSTIEEVTAATQGGGKRKVFGGGAREVHDNDVAIICERGYSAEAAGTALRNNNYSVTAALKSLSLRGERGNRDRMQRGGPDGGRESSRFAEGSCEDGVDHRGDRGGPRGMRKGLRGREERDSTSGSRSQLHGTAISSTSSDLVGCKTQSSAPTTLFDMISTQVNLPEQQQHAQLRARGDDVRTSHLQSHQPHGQNGFAPFGEQYPSYESSGGQRGNRSWPQGNSGGTNTHSGAQGLQGHDGNRGLTNKGERLDRASGRDELNRRHPERVNDHRNRDMRDGQGHRDGMHRRVGHDNVGGSTNRVGQRGQRVDNYVAEFPTLPSSGSNSSRRTEEQVLPTMAPQSNQARSFSNLPPAAYGSSGVGAYQIERSSAHGPPRSSRNCASGVAQFQQGAHKLKAGQRVFAKYWEDDCMYRAVVHEMAASGRTCVVVFVEYGNYEEVLVQDIEQTTWEDSGTQRFQHGNTASGGPQGKMSGSKDRRFGTTSLEDGGSQKDTEHQGGYSGNRGSRRPGGGGHRGGYRGGGFYRAVPRRQQMH
ncbi:tudor domain-containing protein 3-like [Tropilaelaps mercedesae]|uniref:Tudor domain-containing protein 3-like n=1 Tax=Tropilaelaps mercedesae TaxID=418985 RepID=A0A1V9XVH9_9ACAR|nr:tudor domain-containing protein 3-like [Tropilaelaps mercedesae]